MTFGLELREPLERDIRNACGQQPSRVGPVGEQGALGFGRYEQVRVAAG